MNNGAVTYLMMNGSAGGNYGLGIMSDSVYGGSVAAGTASSVQLTTSWGVNAAFEHHWNPHWQTSVYGGYIATTYNALANAMLCVAENSAVPGPGSTSGTAAVGFPGCNNNFSQWNIGTRTQWNIDSQTYIGVDVMYQALNTATLSTFLGGVGSGTGTFSFGQQPVAARTASDQSAFVAQFRVHRNFYP